MAEYLEGGVGGSWKKTYSEKNKTENMNMFAPWISLICFVKDCDQHMYSGTDM